MPLSYVSSVEASRQRCLLVSQGRSGGLARARWQARREAQLADKGPVDRAASACRSAGRGRSPVGQSARRGPHAERTGGPRAGCRLARSLAGTLQKQPQRTNHLAGRSRRSAMAVPGGSRRRADVKFSVRVRCRYRKAPRHGELVPSRCQGLPRRARIWWSTKRANWFSPRRLVLRFSAPA